MITPALLALALAAKPAPPPLAPAGPWYVRAEEEMCLLERRYPLGDRTMSLIFQPLLDLDQMEVYVISPGQGQQYAGKFSARVASSPEPFAGSYYSVGMPKTKNRLTRLTADRRLLEGLKDGDTLQIQAKPVDQTFTIVRPDKARVALQSCIDSLKKAWGIDADMAARAVVPMEGNPARYFGPDAYPYEAYRQGVYGRVVALLNIGTTGAVDHCRIVSSAGQLLNEGTCKAAARIRFKPPRDKDGKPLASTYVLPVRWVLPGSPG